MVISLFEGKCPECQSPHLQISHYRFECRDCGFCGQSGRASIYTDREMNAMELLSAHGGRVIMVYGTLKDIEYKKSQDILRHPRYRRSEYQRLLNFYNAIAEKSAENISRKKLQLDDFLM